MPVEGAIEGAKQIKDWLGGRRRVLADGNRLEPALYVLAARSMLNADERSRLHVIEVPESKPRVVNNSRAVCKRLRGWKESNKPIHIEEDLETKFFL